MGAAPIEPSTGRGGAVVEPPSAALPDEAYVIALASLDHLGPRRLVALLDAFDPASAWRVVSLGRVVAEAPPALIDALGTHAEKIETDWRRQAVRLSPAQLWERHVASGIGIALRAAASFPTPFVDDIEPPSIIFSSGDPDVIIGPRVAIVGTRDCTRYGYDIARQLGAELSEAGVGVVSGLALGIDGAAHTGALDVHGAPPVAVVGSGLDVVYPRRHADLWRRVADRGVVLTGHPLGTKPVAWHFPARNRLIVALADLLIVVESQLTGGSMHTVEEAVRRDVPVLAVPGPVTSKVSAGTNKLLYDGMSVCREPADVLVALGLEPGGRRKAAERRPAPSAEDRAILEAFEWQPATFDHLVLRTGRDLLDLTVALDRLADAGWVDRRGGWYERIAKPGG